jgi:hypothetical protein
LQGKPALPPHRTQTNAVPDEAQSWDAGIGRVIACRGRVTFGHWLDPVPKRD